MAVRSVENRLAASGAVMSVGLCSADLGAPALAAAPGTTDVSRDDADRWAPWAVRLVAARFVAPREIGADGHAIFQAPQAKAAGVVLAGRGRRNAVVDEGRADGVAGATMTAVGIEVLAGFLARACAQAGLAAALALLAASATGSVAAVLVLVALLADLLAGEGGFRASKSG